MKKKILTLIGMLILAITTNGLAEEEIPTFDLEEIVVTATRSEHLLKDSPASTTVITKKEIEDARPQTTKELLEDVAGVSIMSYGAKGALSTVSIRGSGSKQVLVLMDGRPLNQPSSGQIDLSLIPIENIERIEIVRGPVSSLYGANAMGGVINIITRTPPERVECEIGLTAGSFNTKTYSVVGGGRFDGLGYLVTGGYSSSDGIRENSDSTTQNFSAKIGVDFEEYSLSLLFDYLDQEKGTPGPLRWPSPEARQEDRTRGVDFNYRLALGETTGLSGKVYRNYGWNLYKRTPDDEEKPMENNVLGGEVQLDFDLPRILFILGIGLEEDSAESENIDGKHTAQKHAAYIQSEIDLLNWLTATFGLRYDDHSVYGSELNPRSALLIRYREKTGLRLLYGTSFRAPTMNDLYWYEDWGGGIGMFGNPDLEPERSKSYELGIEHRFSKKLLGRVSLFRNDVEDLIGWTADDPDDPFSSWRPRNIATAYFEGLEQEMRIAFNDRWSARVNYTHLEARGKEEDETEYKVLSYRPENKGQIEVNYENENGLGGSLSLDYTGPRYTSDRPKYSPYDLEAYTLLNLRISQGMEQGDIFLKVDNITNVDYQVIRGYPMPGRSITGGAKIRF